MAIYSTSGVTERRERGYPKLRRRKYDGIVVLFTSSIEGTVVFSNETFMSVGYHTANWTYGEFEDYPGSIVLEND